MKRLLTGVLASITLVLLSGCALIERNSETLLQAGQAGSVVLSADELAHQIAVYIAGDQIAIDELLQPDGPVDYGLRVADFMKGNLDVPVVQVAAQYPQYLASFKAQMLTGQAALVGYSQRSGRPIPQALQIMWANGVEAMVLFDKAGALGDETLQIRRLYATISPWVRLGLSLGGVGPMPMSFSTG